LGCGQDKRNASEQLVREWIGREIVFPDDPDCSHMGMDTACPPRGDAAYTLLAYTDSVGCTGCRLNLAAWKRYVREMDSIAPNRVRFAFHFRPKSLRELGLLLRRERLDLVVFVDRDGSFARENRFPADMAHQCFLLDRDNRVLAMGNPTLNPKLWELYKAIVTGEGYGTEVEKSNARAP